MKDKASENLIVQESKELRKLYHDLQKDETLAKEFLKTPLKIFERYGIKSGDEILKKITAAGFDSRFGTPRIVLVGGGLSYNNTHAADKEVENAWKDIGNWFHNII